VQRTGARGSGDALTVVGRPTRGGLPGRVGFTVPKKVGKAHVRNLVKRRLRHLMRLRKQAFEGRDLILIAREPAAALSFAALESELDKVLARLEENARRPRPPRRHKPRP
jgi:ribonuclease P protein component